MAMEQQLSRGIVTTLDEYRKSRDMSYERSFAALYGWPSGPAKPQIDGGHNRAAAKRH
jgi:hypothetical protein